MPNELEEIHPEAEEPEGTAPSEPLEPEGDGADTMASGDLAPIEDADAMDVSDTMAQSSVSSSHEEMPGGATVSRGSTAAYGPVNPKSNIFTLILILAFLCIVLAIYLLAHELNNYYGVTFGGIMSPPDKTTETTETEN